MLIWSMASPDRLDKALREAVAETRTNVFVSSASVWEVAIKQAAGRLTFPLDEFDEVARRMGLDVLPILPAHAIKAGSLPRHHSDPFDQMLIAQALVENLTLATSDAVMAKYDVPIFRGTK